MKHTYSAYKFPILFIILGVIIGIAIGLSLAQYRIQQFMRGPIPPNPETVMWRLEMVLDLTADQKEKIRPHLIRHHGQMKKLHPMLYEEIKKFRINIDQHLTPAQRKKLDEKLQGFEREPSSGNPQEHR